MIASAVTALLATVVIFILLDRSERVTVEVDILVDTNAVIDQQRRDQVSQVISMTVQGSRSLRLCDSTGTGNDFWPSDGLSFRWRFSNCETSANVSIFIRDYGGRIRIVVTANSFESAEQVANTISGRLTKLVGERLTLHFSSFSTQGLSDFNSEWVGDLLTYQMALQEKRLQQVVARPVLIVESSAGISLQRDSFLGNWLVLWCCLFSLTVVVWASIVSLRSRLVA